MKSGLGRITENTPQYQGVIVYNMADLPLVMNVLYFYAPNFEKVGDILVSACPYVCVCVCVYGASRYRLETSCMDS